MEESMPRDILELPAPPAGRRLSYGPNALHFGDLRMPAGAGPHPAIIYIHGGFWRAKYGLEHAGHFCEALRSAGVATWNIEYRRVGQDGGGWPGTLDDVLRAARFIERIARSHPIDLERVLVAGHSAGGQLALWVAAQDAIELRGAVSLGGVVDLRRAFELRLGDGAVEQFLGAAPDEAPERYDTASPIDLLPFRTPQLLIHGTWDDVVPIELADRFDAASNNCKILRLEGGDHFDAIDPRSAYWPMIADTLLRALAV
jgi:acetyl esterase/lipase